MTSKREKPSRPPNPPLKLVDEDDDTPVDVDALYDALVALLISARTRGKIPGPDGIIA